ncbi:hypothetical protein ABUW04_07020 [Streptacidiphilus sp. N1-10]|uniref:HD domain-containing protein n=1 Tax=Streptacidiphilus jeojiensis TaxID=3229225 RepID=A0ABV6XJ35_9ACTN
MSSQASQPNASPQGRVASAVLPGRQSMDRDALGWITSRRPFFTAPVPRRARGVTALIPSEAWFCDAARADSIHGVRHNARVSLLAALLAQEHGLDAGFATVLSVAGAVHDCRRHDDRGDPGHGQRAADWFQQHADQVSAVLGVDMAPQWLQPAVLAIALHDIPYPAFTPDQRRAYTHWPHMVDLLKAADCLDRYRLPRTSWWPDPARLRVTVPSWLHPFAFDLMVSSEQARLDGADNRTALSRAH